jgi:hypothetical protein
MAFGLPRSGGLDMRHRLPGLSVGLAAMFAVIAYRCVRGLSDPIRGSGQGECANFG